MQFRYTNTELTQLVNTWSDLYITFSIAQLLHVRVRTHK